MHLFIDSLVPNQTQSKTDVAESFEPNVPGHREAPIVSVRDSAELSDVFVFDGKAKKPDAIDSDLILDPEFEDALAQTMRALSETQAGAAGQGLSVARDRAEPDVPEAFDQAFHDALKATIETLDFV